MYESIEPDLAIFVFCKQKYIVRSKARKHNYRTRTGPRCCNNNCASKGISKEAVRYNNRIRKRNFGVA